MQQHHVRVLGVDLIELGPDLPVIGGVAAREGDLRPGGHKHLGIGTPPGREEIPAVDQRMR